MRTFFATMVGLLSLGAVVPGLVSPVAAADGDSCTYEVTASGIKVSWDIEVADSERLIVERQAFDRFWWRGVVEGGEFSDQSPPRTAASIDYRMVVRSANGRVQDRIDCDLVNTLDCAAIATEAGYEITHTETDGEEVVLRRQTKQDGRYYWRGVHDLADSYTDRSSPTGTANYRIWARTDGVIVAGGDCTDAEVPQECLQFHANDDDFPGLETNLQPASEEIAAELGIDGPAYVGPDGLIYFVRFVEDELEDSAYDEVVRVDPATGDETVLAEYGLEWSTDIRFIDDLGGLYLDQWGGGSRSTRVESVGVLDNAGFFNLEGYTNGILPIVNLADGRTLRTDMSDVWDGEIYRYTQTYNPQTGVSERIPCLDDVYVTGVDDTTIYGVQISLDVRTYVSYDYLPMAVG